MTFIGDRFVSVGHQWLDIVTGRHAAVRVGAPPASLDARERMCRERWSWVTPGPRLIDFGRQGSVGWFEAEAADAIGPPAAVRRLIWPQAVELADAIADGRAAGRVALAAPAGAGFGMLCEQLAPLLRAAGFVTLRADVPMPYRLRRQLMHRHVAIVVPSEATRAFAAGWLSQLAIVSDRRHVCIERVTESAMAGLRLRPFAESDLVEAAQNAGARGEPSVKEGIELAAVRSGGWPAAFVRHWSALAPANVARERSPAFDLGAPPISVARDLARAATYARRKRPAGESQWHSAAVAAAARRGDQPRVVAATEHWVERLVDEGRFARAVAVATRALAGAPLETRIALTVLAARAHLAAASVTRAETLITTAIAMERMQSGAASAAMIETWLEVLFWKGRWQELRSTLSASTTPNTSDWLEVLDWADRGELAPDAPGPHRDAQLFRGSSSRERGLSDAIAIAVRRSDEATSECEQAWLDDLIRRERLRGLTRFSQGKSTMQMLRDMATLLEIVQSAEDETAGLVRVCDWVRSSSGASACVMVTADVTVVAGEPLKSFGLDARSAARWLESAEPQLETSGVRVTAHAPIRFAGATVAAIAATGPEECGRAFFNAVQAASAVCGSLVRSKLDAIAASAHGDGLAGEILGTSPAIRSVRALVARVALAPFPVVIEGESGTGKELVARALHRHSPRRDRTFAALNCAALTDDLIEAELFGHARGAFTHAVNARTGLFEDAHRGTLFLDEVGELSPRAQAKLLRALQEGEIRRVGENEARPVDVRVIAATNRPLSVLAAEGRFREDLMFRLSVVKIAVPPLRERAEDVAQLAFEFWRGAAKRVGTHATLEPDAVALLGQLPWPGNVRQLQNAMAALAVAAPKAGRVGARLIRMVLDGLVDLAAGDVVPLEEARRQVERRVVSAALAKHTGNRADAARALGLSRQGLAKALRRLGLAEAGAA